MPATDPAKQLARQLADLQRQVSSLSRGSQASNRSIEGGAIAVYDGDGNLRGTVGQLPDGTTGFLTVNGPPPPMPSAPILEPTIGGLDITWDGTFFGGAEKPGDFHRLEVHASTYSVYTPSEATHRLDLIGAGTAHLILPAAPWTIVFVAVSTAGNHSAPSIAATETPEQAPTYTEVIAANGKNKVFWRKDSAAPTKDADKLITGDLWFQTDHDNRPVHWDDDSATWVEGALGDDAISGLNVGKLVAGEISAGQKIIAGPQFGTHAEMASDGFRVYRQDPDDGSTDEVIRLGTSTNDYFAVVDTTGNLVASVDDTGQGNFTGLNVTGDAVIQGRSLSDLLGDVASASPGYFEGRLSADLGPIRSRVGVAEVSVRLRKGRRYQFNFRAGWKSTIAVTESRWNLLRTHAPESDPENCPAPTITSPSEEVWWTTSPAGQTFLTFGGNAEFIAETTGRHRLLLTVERGGSTSDSDIYVLSSQTINLVVTDLGPAAAGSTGVFTQAGGTLYGGPPAPPAGNPVQQYYVDLAPAGRATYRGNGSLRTDVSEVVQGMDPSGYNGDGRGQFWFNLPTITGTVDRVDVYLYSTHWYYNSGGTAILNISDQRGVGPSPYKFRGDWYVGGYPKPGGKTVTVPSDWLPFFRGTNNDNYNGRATVITLGPGNGSNYAYYGKFSDCRLRIWYTQ